MPSVPLQPGDIWTESRWVERETILPLALGALVAVLGHVLLLPSITRMIVDSPATLGSFAAPEKSEASQPEANAQTPLPEQLPAPEEAPPPPRPEIQLGRDNAPPRQTVAWISYDDFQELIAPRNEVIQPAVQQQTDPVPDAPAEMDPTPPAPQPAASAPPTPAAAPPQPPVAVLLPREPMPAKSEEPQPQTENPQRQLTAEGPENPQGQPREQPEAKTDAPAPDGAPVEQVAVHAPLPLSPQPDPAGEKRAEPTEPIALKTQAQATGPQPDEQLKPIEQPAGKAAQPADTGDPAARPAIDTPQPVGEPLPAQPAPPTPTPAPTPPTRAVAQPTEQPNPAQPEAAPTPAAAPAATPRPTSAARSDKESQPFILDPKDLKGRIGSVLVGPGIEIKTVLPRISAVSSSFLFTPNTLTDRAMAAPATPVVKLIFDHTDGKVIEAQIIHSSGYTQIDSPILASLYKWRASGKLLTERQRPVELEIVYRIN